ncbi:MAG: hypothetical protein [Caudoviricetes sp.]|nr:MAG: hypothetical protein [Caudoviricetes sp.]
MLYEIKYKFRGQVRFETVESDNEFQAVADLAYRLKRGLFTSKHELEILTVSTHDEYNCLMLNHSYVTNEGKTVVMKEIHQVGTDYETMSDQHGHHRYSRSQGRIVGRSTGSPVNGPNSIALGVYWTKGETC